MNCGRYRKYDQKIKVVKYLHYALLPFFCFYYTTICNEFIVVFRTYNNYLEGYGTSKEIIVAMSQHFRPI